MARALVTGVTGQDGRYLAELLLSKGYQVFGLVRADASVDGVEPVRGDVTDPASLARALETARPDEVYNLAAVSGVAESWADPAAAAAVNALGALHLLEAVRRAGAPIRVFQASSGEIFAPSERPLAEQSPLGPSSPYGVAKLFAHQTVGAYRAAHQLHASAGILFNHNSPRRGEEFAARRISRGVAEVATGRRARLPLGNLDARRDWGWAPDYVDAMWRMLQRDEPGDYVVATGAAHSVREFVAAAFAVVGIEDWAERVEHDAARLRPADAPAVVGDATRARQQLGWAPTVDFAELVRRLVEADLAALG